MKKFFLIICLFFIILTGCKNSYYHTTHYPDYEEYENNYYPDEIYMR